MAVLFAMRRVVTALLFTLRNDTWVGNPSGPPGHLPCKAEEFFGTARCRVYQIPH